mmetsp:Transcript_5441/g.15266  ORF Transcript_5441/g.15266 Transcript_5441/m.15266 type:complete len:211 (-) Transcript_5441:390-1022(-)
MSAASSDGVMKPTDMTPSSTSAAAASSGWLTYTGDQPDAARCTDWPRSPSICGSDGPQMSTSSSPTRRPRAASAKPSCAVMVDLPTPPLQLLMPTSAPTCRSDGGALEPINERGRESVDSTLLRRAHGRASIAAAAAASTAPRLIAPERNSSLTATVASGCTASRLQRASAGSSTPLRAASASSSSRARPRAVARAHRRRTNEVPMRMVA